jgi:pimeloyl-ACP methyl ester carboxylesterase
MPLEWPQLVPRIEGAEDGPTLFFVQGWPDDWTLWDELVGALRDRNRCVRINLPNYPGAAYRRWAYDHTQMVEGLARCIRAVSPGRPVTLIAHDWGAFWGYRLHAKYPELIARYVALDIGPRLRPSAREAAILVSYQSWLALAFVVGGKLGDTMTRALARLAQSPRQGEMLSASVNYPYFYTVKQAVTGALPSLSGYRPEVPLLFVYGTRKPARFHTQGWLDFLRSRAGNEVIELSDASHWVTCDPRLTGLVTGFLERTKPDTNF